MDFKSALDVKLGEVERPPLAPLGTYVMRVSSVPELGEIISDKGNWDTVRFILTGVAPHLVDEDALAEFGSAQNIVVRKEFLLDRDDATKFKQTLFQLQNFLFNHLGIEEGTKMKEALNASVNHQCLVTLKYRPDKNDPEVQWLDVKSTAPVE